MKKLFIIISILTALWGPSEMSAESCGLSGPKSLDVDTINASSLPSPNGKWELQDMPPSSVNDDGTLFLSHEHGQIKRKLATISRSGTVVWSQDSNRILFLDQYDVEHAKVRVFDIKRVGSYEVPGINESIKKLINKQVPRGKDILFLAYPSGCFSVENSSIVKLQAQIRVGPSGTLSGPIKTLTLHITLNTDSMQVELSQP